MSIEDTLAERGERYGMFADNASLAQSLKEVMRSSPGWERLTDDKREALDQIQSKISRIITGDSNYKDSWTDISGYSTLIARVLK